MKYRRKRYVETTGDHHLKYPAIKKVRDAVSICKWCDRLFINHGICKSGKKFLSVCPGDWILTDGDVVLTCKPEVFKRSCDTGI